MRVELAVGTEQSPFRGRDLPARMDDLAFGALVAVNLQTAFLSPPVAMSAYYLKNVMPLWSLGTIYRGMGNFMVIQILCLAAVLLWPEIALWLPRAMQ